MYIFFLKKEQNQSTKSYLYDKLKTIKNTRLIMLRCPNCNQRFPYWRIFFYLRNTRFICSECKCVSKIKINYLQNSIIWVCGLLMAMWIVRSKFSSNSIYAFILLAISVVIIQIKALELELEQWGKPNIPEPGPEVKARVMGQVPHNIYIIMFIW